MELRRSRALLLDVRELQERDRIVTFLTPEHGRRDGVANGARRRYSRFQGRLEPWSLVEMSWSEKPERELVRIRDVDLVRSGYPLRADLERLLAASYLAEHARVFVQENEAAHEAFRLLDGCLVALAGAEAVIGSVLRYFEFWMLRLAGIFPDLEHCASCGERLRDGGRLTPDGDGVVGSCCAADGSGAATSSGALVGAEALALFRRFRTTSPSAMARETPPPVALLQAEAVCRQIRREFLGNELRSYQVMRRTLGLRDLG